MLKVGAEASEAADPWKFGKVTTLKGTQNLHDRVKRNEQISQKDAEIVLNKLSEALCYDPQEAGGVVVDDEDNLFFITDLASCLFYVSARGRNRSMYIHIR